MSDCQWHLSLFCSFTWEQSSYKQSSWLDYIWPFFLNIKIQISIVPKHLVSEDFFFLKIKSKDDKIMCWILRRKHKSCFFLLYKNLFNVPVPHTTISVDGPSPQRNWRKNKKPSHCETSRLRHGASTQLSEPYCQESWFGAILLISL